MLKDTWSLEASFSTNSAAYVPVLNFIKILENPTATNLFWSFDWIFPLSVSSLRYRVLLDGVSIFDDLIFEQGKIENSIKLALHPGHRVFNFQLASPDISKSLVIENLKIMLEAVNEPLESE